MEEWYEAVDALTPHVLRVSTPQMTGTGFLLWRSKNESLCAIATAAHVVNHAQHWDLPVRIGTSDDAHQVLLHADKRPILIDVVRDTAVIVVELDEMGDVPIPAAPRELIEAGYHLRVGNHIGWLGFPAIQAASLCYFSGAVSAWLEEQKSYFIDGVAINGVSGGPAFNKAGAAPYIIGVVSAYMPNRVTGETLPGLAIVRDVSQFHDVISEFNSIEDAQEKAAETMEAPPPPPIDPPSAPSVPSGARRAT